MIQYQLVRGYFESSMQNPGDCTRYVHFDSYNLFFRSYELMSDLKLPLNFGNRMSYVTLFSYSEYINTHKNEERIEGRLGVSKVLVLKVDAI